MLRISVAFQFCLLQQGANAFLISLSLERSTRGRARKGNWVPRAVLRAAGIAHTGADDSGSPGWCLHRASPPLARSAELISSYSVTVIVH